MSPTKEKKRLLHFCQEKGLSRLVKSMQASKEPCLRVFFSAKTHKEGVPIRAIVSKKNSWQREVAKYLQRSLSRLVVDDPFLIKKSEQLTVWLQGTELYGCGAFPWTSKTFIILFLKMPCVVRWKSVLRTMDWWRSRTSAG